MADETNPTIAASVSTERSTCPPARADDPQQGEFPRPLADDDRERVVDGERADEQRDQREDKQRRVEERQRLAHHVLRPRR